MSKNHVYSLVLIFVLLGAFGSAIRIQSAEGSGTIFIRANGLVEGTDKITNENNVTYTFTDDINDSVVVERSNIIIDGDEYTLNGSWSLVNGFNLTSVSNVTIMNVNIVEFGYAMWLEGASQCVVSNNTCIDNEGGIWLVSSIENTVSSNNIVRSVEGVALDSSSGNSILGNNITDSYNYGVYVRNNSSGNTISGNNIKGTINGAGIYLSGSPNNVISGNNIKNSPNEHICLLSSSNNNIISGNTLTNSTADVGMYVYQCSLNSFFGNNITVNANTGIRLDSSGDSIISGNNISENGYGVYLWYSSNITVSGNDIVENGGSGIALEGSNYNSVGGNNIEANSNEGIWILSNSYYNDVTGNNIGNGYDGILVQMSNYNMVIGNNITGNGHYGVFLFANIYNNTFYHNNFLGNAYQAGTYAGYPSVHVWDNGYPSGGNYWSDYSGSDEYKGPDQDIPGSDFIGDDWYVISENNTDHYPLMIPYETTPPTIIITSPENKTYAVNTGIQLNFTIDEFASWIGYSLNGQPNATITGNVTLPFLLDGWHNVTVYANDTFGNVGMGIVYFAVDTTAPNITSITQFPLVGSVMPEDEVNVNAAIIDFVSKVKQVMLNYTWTNGTKTWSNIVSMTNLGGDVWNATIPAFSYGTNVTYFIIAEDYAGNIINSVGMEFECEYQVIPEFPLLSFLVLFMVATLLALLVWRRKRSTLSLSIFCS